MDPVNLFHQLVNTHRRAADVTLDGLRLAFLSLQQPSLEHKHTNESNKQRTRWKDEWTRWKDERLLFLHILPAEPSQLMNTFIDVEPSGAEASNLPP